MAERLTLTPGVEVTAARQRYRLERILDLETVLAQATATGESRLLKVADLTPTEPTSQAAPPDPRPDLVTCTDADW